MLIPLDDARRRIVESNLIISDLGAKYALDFIFYFSVMQMKILMLCGSLRRLFESFFISSFERQVRSRQVGFSLLLQISSSQHEPMAFQRNQVFEIVRLCKGRSIRYPKFIPVLARLVHFLRVPTHASQVPGTFCVPKLEYSKDTALRLRGLFIQKS